MKRATRPIWTLSRAHCSVLQNSFGIMNTSPEHFATDASLSFAVAHRRVNSLHDREALGESTKSRGLCVSRFIARYYFYVNNTGLPVDPTSVVAEELTAKRESAAFAEQISHFGLFTVPVEFIAGSVVLLVTSIALAVAYRLRNCGAQCFTALKWCTAPKCFSAPKCFTAPECCPAPECFTAPKCCTALDCFSALDCFRPAAPKQSSGACNATPFCFERPWPARCYEAVVSFLTTGHHVDCL